MSSIYLHKVCARNSNTSLQWDVEEEEREQEKKQKKLAQAELLKIQKRKENGTFMQVSFMSITLFNSLALSAEKQDTTVQKSEGFIARLVQKAIDNIQITVEHVHIRYEDNRSDHPFACGLTLDSLSARSTDSAWKPAFLTTEHTLVHKVMCTMLRACFTILANAKHYFS